MLLGEKQTFVQIHSNCGLICDFVKKVLVSHYRIRVVILMYNSPPELKLLKLRSMNYYLIAYAGICSLYLAHVFYFPPSICLIEMIINKGNKNVTKVEFVDFSPNWDLKHFQFQLCPPADMKE